MPDIDTMPAGAELDARVATAMGWTDGPHIFYAWQDRKQKARPKFGFHCAPGDGIGDYSSHVDESGQKFYCGEPKPLFFPGPYSTDWAAAGEVQSHLSGTGLRMCLIEFADFWQCVFHGIGASGMWASADTRELAIARAAVMAAEKGGE